MKSSLARNIGIAPVLFALLACGQPGPLYMPKPLPKAHDKAAPAAAVAPAVTPTFSSAAK